MSSPRPPEPWPPSTPEGRFGQPDPDDDDTGPLQVTTPSPSVDDAWDDGGETNSLPEAGLPGDARLYTPRDSDWPRQFEPLTVNPLPVRRGLKPIVLLGAVALLLVVVIGGLRFWQLRSSAAAPSSHSTDTTTSTTASASADPEA